MPTNMKHIENITRKKSSIDAGKQFKILLDGLPPKNNLPSGYMGKIIPDSMYGKIQKWCKVSAQPTPHDYAQIAQWCDENNINIVGSPFEADAQMCYME